MTSDDDFPTYEFSPNLSLDPLMFPGHFNMDVPHASETQYPKPNSWLYLPRISASPPCVFPTQDAAGQTTTLSRILSLAFPSSHICSVTKLCPFSLLSCSCICSFLSTPTDSAWWGRGGEPGWGAGRPELQPRLCHSSLRTRARC